MKSILIIILAICLISREGTAGHSELRTSYQPLDGLDSAQIKVVQVTCHHWHANSANSAVDLIHLPNVPPTDNPADANMDLNLASICGIRFSTHDLGALGAEPMITFDATKLDLSKADHHPREDLIRAALECLRLCLPPELMSTKVTLRCREADREWLSMIVSEFDSAPRDKPFHTAR
jgi:hypothetical protein